MQGIHVQHIDQEPGVQCAAGCHEHHEKHEYVPYRGLPVLQDGRADVEFLCRRAGHLPKENAYQHRGDDAAGYDHRGAEPVQGLPVVEKEHQGEDADRHHRHVLAVDLLHWDPTADTGVPEHDQYSKHGHQQEDYHHVVHVLPVIVVGHDGGKHHGQLPGRKHQRIEIGVELTADVLRGEPRLDGPDEPEHDERLEEAQQEARHRYHGYMFRLRAHQAQDHLEEKVHEQKGAGRHIVKNLRDNRIGYRHPGRGTVVGHHHILAHRPQGIRYLQGAAGVGPVHH